MLSFSCTILTNSFKMTPLHLPVQGNIVPCKEEKKVEPIVPLPQIETKKDK